MVLAKTVFDGYELHHQVQQLGEGVAGNVVNLIRLYAQRAGVRDVPPVFLHGSAWSNGWAEVSVREPVYGDADSSARGKIYQRLSLEIPDQVPPGWTPWHPVPHNIESAIAHELTHLRWSRLRNGPELDARTLALLRGAQFPAGGGWSKATHEALRKARTEIANFRRGLLEVR
jgi:hypothetical protein